MTDLGVGILITGLFIGGVSVLMVYHIIDILRSRVKREEE